MDNDVKQKIDSVDEYIDKLARKLADNNDSLKVKLKGEIKEIILQNDLRSDESSSILRILSEETSGADSELIIKAKEASLELSRLDIDLVRAYRGENFTNNLVEETKKNNPNMTEDHARLVHRLADNINRVYNSDGGIEDKKDAVLEEYKKESPGKIKTSWNDTRGIIGLLKQKPKQFKEIVDNHEKITNELQNEGIKLPYEKFDKLASYDRVMSSIKNPEMRRFIESARSRFQTLEKLTNGRFSQISNNFINRIGSDRLRNAANNFFNKSIVKVSNGVATKIGSQPIGDFVSSSVVALSRSDFQGGFRSIISGLRESRSKSYVSGINIPSGGLNIPTSLTAKTGSFLKKSFSDGFSKLGIGVKKSLANNFGKVGGAMVRGLNAAVTLPTKLVGSLGIKAVAPFIIGFFLVFFLLSILQTNSNISSIVNILDDENVDTDITDITDSEVESQREINQPGDGSTSTGTDWLSGNTDFKCNVINKTVPLKQCDDYNRNVKINNAAGTCGETSVSKNTRTVCTSGCALVSTAMILQAHDSKNTPECLITPGLGCDTSIRGYLTSPPRCNITWTGIKTTINNTLEGDAINIEFDKDGDPGGADLKNCNEQWIRDAICANNVVIVLFGYYPDDSGRDGGHWVLAVAVTEDGEIALRDPMYNYGYLSNFKKQKNAKIDGCMAVKADYINNSPAFDGDQEPGEEITDPESLANMKTLQNGVFLEKTSGSRLNYILYLPANYDSQKEYPLLVYLHGSGEQGDNYNDFDLLYDNKNTIPGIIKEGNYYDAIIVSPQSPVTWTSTWGKVMPMINEIMEEYRVDDKRISLTAHSDGVWGLWEIVNNNPGFFSVVVPIASSSDPDNYNGLTDTKVWSYWMTGDNTQKTNPDGTWTTNKSALIKAINEASGVENATVTRIDGNHGSTRLIYLDRHIIELMLSQINPNK